MFRWCSFCQKLMGESEPYDDFRLTHGCCTACEPLLENYQGPEERVLRARDVFEKLMKAGLGGAGDEELADFTAQAKAAGLAPAEILLGVVGPALCQIGKLWEAGRVTPEQEHKFSAFCARIYDRLSTPPPSYAGRRIVVALAPGNRHDLGPRMIESLARGRGIDCRVLPVGVSPEAVLATVEEFKPHALGVSVAMEESIPAARKILERAARPGLKLLLGGRAARAIAPDSLPGIVVVRKLDDFLLELDSPGSR